MLSQTNSPESHRQVPNRLDTEDAAARVTLECMSIRLIGYSVLAAQMLVEDDHCNGTEHREKRDDRRNPERPGVRVKISRNHIRGGLTRELRKVGDTPIKSWSAAILRCSLIMFQYQIAPAERKDF